MTDRRRGQIISSLKDIELEKLKNPTLLKQSFNRADSKTKGLISVLSILILVSLLSTLLSSYYVFTKPVRSNTGVFKEGVVGNNVSGFNPVVENTTDGKANTLELKVDRLVYAPLYTVTTTDTNNLTQNSFQIKPVLLNSVPTWTEVEGDNAYKSLKLNIKEEAKWSDGKSVSCEDLEYTIERFKEPRGNSNFKTILSGTTFSTNTPKECMINFEKKSPWAIYKLGFSPIPKHAFEGANIDGIIASPKYKNPEIVSGYYKVLPKVKDLETQKDEQNPIKKDGKTTKVILTKSGINNYGGEEVAFDQYIFKNYDSLTPDKIATNLETLSKDAELGNVDLFTRNYDQNLNNTTKEVKDALKMEQKVVPNNNYLQLFYNIQKGSEGYLINQSLRKYISCNLLNFKSVEAEGFYSEVSVDKKLVPVELNGSVADYGCGMDYKALLDKVYKFNEVDGKQRISIGASNPFTLTLVGYKEHLPILNELQIFLSSIGIDSKIVSEDAQVLEALNSKKYHIALLNNRIDSFDLLSEFSAKEQDLVSIPGNDRIAQYNVNQNLETFSNSNGTNEEARQNLIKFFSEQFVFMNLHQSKAEVNYSSKIFGLGTNLPNFASGIQTGIYNNINSWYTETKRKFSLGK